MSNPILALIPSGYKAQKVYSVLPSDGSGDFTFERNGKGTRVNKDGLIETIGTSVDDLVRLDWLNSNCPSLLIEPLRTNRQVRSEELDNASWSKTNTTVTANQTTAPTGELTADKLSRTSTAANYVGGIVSKSASSQLDAVSSYFVKQGQGDFIAFRGQGSYPNRVDAIFQFSTKTLTTSVAGSNFSVTSSQVQDYGNGWYRLSVVYNTDAAANIQSILSPRATSGQIDATDTSTSSFAYVWGVQFEEGSCLSSYIETGSAATTRLADICKDGGNSTLFDIIEGSFFIDVLPYNSGLVSTISLSNNSTSQRILIQFQSNGTQVRLFSSGGVSNYQTITFNQRNKILVTFKLNEYKFYINGALVSTDTSATVPTSLDRLNFSNSTANSDFFQGEVNDTRVYDTVLTQAEAIKLTT